MANSMDEDDSHTLPLSIDSDDESSTYIPSEVLLRSTTSRSIYENGRTYHGYREGSYWGPNDEPMLKHEELIHNMCIYTLRDRHYLAPIYENPQLILDIGTGGGRWAMNMADRFPDAKVIGMDLTRPRPHDIPPNNVEWLVDDAQEDWTFPEDHFDFIHIRGLFGSISDWPKLYNQALRHLKPGGWLEQMEWSTEMKSDDGSLAPDAILSQWSREATEASRLQGKTFQIAETMKGLIDDAGFVSVTEKMYKWPIGTWPRDEWFKELGRKNIQNWEMGMEGWVLALFTRLVGWSKEQVDSLLTEVRQALYKHEQHVYHDVHLVYAQKPA